MKTESGKNTSSTAWHLSTSVSTSHQEMSRVTRSSVEMNEVSIMTTTKYSKRRCKEFFDVKNGHEDETQFFIN